MTVSDGEIDLTPPADLGPGGLAHWQAVTALHAAHLTEPMLPTLREACRALDRLDRLDLILRGDVDTWVSLTHDLRTQSYLVKVNGALDKANATASTFRQLMTSLRLPDEVTGVRPQRRPQRVEVPGGKPAKVSALDAARRRAAG